MPYTRLPFRSIMINQQCSKSQAHAYDSTAITIYGHVLCITILCVLLLATCHLFVIDMMCACVHDCSHICTHASHNVSCVYGRRMPSGGAAQAASIAASHTPGCARLVCRCRRTNMASVTTLWAVCGRLCYTAPTTALLAHAGAVEVLSVQGPTRTHDAHSSTCTHNICANSLPLL